MSVINALIEAWNNTAPYLADGLSDRVIGYIFETGFRYCLKRWRDGSRVKAIDGSSAHGVAPPQPEARQRGGHD
ncbi:MULTISPECIES: hypothetical protein [unclassified Brevundimonas]|uniref:hypothetical protein n=1 Tax=unclassified Brevundimonas TaxID=2622653 RepID=UPI0025C3C887|nr:MULTISPECIES: hypothetical protein [unclassified Brevundimonas]